MGLFSDDDDSDKCPIQDLTACKSSQYKKRKEKENHN